ncbi:hypothetical protein EXU85_11520 [Spirosoma sp. KCTC 42546]|uniref:hypothetical protein n=1 Tax=Spirosoma sp. KCTC 42546 TaxID=2520506 RepID=UPI0011594484|nr:hypothetical protein [Spirosoma sp. KCTC 42546]QDK79200.1 hypothetical protein EXU85_11520 [Spirosoma sp. KCTC 42546]
MQINVNADGTISGIWWDTLENTTGTLTGQVEEGKRVRGKWGIEPERDIDFRLAESGLTFTGEYGPPTAWGTSRRFYWNGTKISNCDCPNSIYTKP